MALTASDVRAVNATQRSNARTKILDYAKSVLAGKNHLNRALPDWKVKMKNMPGLMGTCSYKDRTIYLAEDCIGQISAYEWNDTIIHELAHAFTPTEAEPHGDEFRDMYYSLGGENTDQAGGFSGKSSDPIALSHNWNIGYFDYNGVFMVVAGTKNITKKLCDDKIQETCEKIWPFLSDSLPCEFKAKTKASLYRLRAVGRLEFTDIFLEGKSDCLEEDTDEEVETE